MRRLSRASNRSWPTQWRCVYRQSPVCVCVYHVQAAAVHQRRELMQADLRGVQDPLDLLQIRLERARAREREREM